MAAQDEEPIPLTGNGETDRDDPFETKMSGMRTRPHHVFFAHHFFRELVFKDPLVLFAVVAAGKGDGLVKEVWRKIGEQVLEGGAGARALPDNGLAVEATDMAGCPAVIIHLPPPKHPTEAYFIAVVLTQRPRRRWLFWRSPPRIRFVTLEHGASLFVDEDPHTVLCEWKEDGAHVKHVNYGRGPVPTRTAFVEAVVNLIFQPLKMLESRLGLGAQHDDSTDSGRGIGISEDLMRAAGEERLDQLEKLIADGADIRAADKQRRMTLLHFAAAYGQTDVMKLLVDKGAEVDATDVQGFTPLHLAAGKAPVAAVELLIAHGADVHARTNEGVTALHSAALGDRTETAKLLIANGADLNARGEHGGSALLYAVSEGHVAMAEFLLAKGASASVKDDKQRTPLHVAANRGHEGLVELLLGSDVDVNAKDSHGHTALQHAEVHDHDGVANILRSN